MLRVARLDRRSDIGVINGAVTRMQPYRPRAIRAHGVRRIGAWRLKSYSISFDGSPVDQELFEPGLALACEALPTPAVTAERPGLGVVVAHAGRGALYIVLGWWDRENELPVRVFIAYRDDGDTLAWRPAREGESFCVWDLEVLWFEREAYVSTLLGGGEQGAAKREYLERWITREPSTSVVG